MRPGLPFASLNLRRNPFGELHADDWGSVVVPAFDLDILSRHVGEGMFAVQFIGEMGRGKSSHMRALHERAAGTFRYFPEDEPVPRACPQGRVLYLDETQRVPARRRRRWWSDVARRKGSLVIGTHVDHEAELRGAGFRVETVLVRGLSVDGLAEICRRRIRLVVRDPREAVPSVERDVLEWLVQCHGDNLRAVVSDLYDHFQTLNRQGESGGKHVQVRHMV